jgi:DNA-binding NarL/FixJ family response regulator
MIMTTTCIDLDAVEATDEAKRPAQPSEPPSQSEFNTQSITRFMKAVCVLITDDQTIVRAGIRQLVSRIGHVVIVGEARDGREALELVKTKRPNIVLMDIEMPGLNGFDATRRIVTEFSDVKVIILSAHATEQHVIQAIHAGAKGFIPKDAEVTEINLAIQCVSKNRTYLSPTVSQHFLNTVRSAGKCAAEKDKSSSLTLSAQQREILRLIVEGKTTEEIGFLLNISPKTVESHRAQIISQLLSTGMA